MVFFDALRVKIRDEGLVRNKAVHLALGVRRRQQGSPGAVARAERRRQVLAARDERAQEPRREDVLLAVVDGLKGFPEAIPAVFPDTVVQTCIVHLLRHSLEFVSCKDRKPVAAALKAIYRAENAAAAERELQAFDEGVWGRKYPTSPRAGGAPGRP